MRFQDRVVEKSSSAISVLIRPNGAPVHGFRDADFGCIARPWSVARCRIHVRTQGTTMASDRIAVAPEPVDERAQ